jgi:G3E family GTPase
LPVTVVTGFLGAGKSTLLRQLLLSSGLRLAVLVNEFGEVGIDGDLIRSCGFCPEDELDGRVVELANGCLCCTVQDEFLPTMKTLLERADQLDGIVVETSGLALPVPVVQAFGWPEIRTRTRVSGVVTVVDGEALAAGSVVGDPAALEAQRLADPNLDHLSSIQELFDDQLEAADLVLLSRADRLEGEQTQPVRADLRRRIEPAYRLERVAEQVEPQRLLGSRRKDVDDPAPQRVFAWFAHGVAAHVAVAGEEARQRLERDALADDRAKTAGGEHFPWRHALQHRVDGRHHDPALARPRGGSPGEFGERGYAAADDIADRRDAVIGQAIPGGEIENRQARREERQGLDDLRAAGRLAGDMQDRAAGRSRRRDGTGIEPRRYACQFGALARRQGRKIGHDAMSAAKRRSRAITALSCSAGTGSRPIAQA